VNLKLNVMRYSKDPKVIACKYTATCKETGEIINPGEKMLYYPIGKECFKIESKQYKEFLEISADWDNGYNY
jgi:hypothetical protein